jgi:hypothetical protein
MMMLLMMFKSRRGLSCLYRYCPLVETVCLEDRTNHTPAPRLHLHRPIARDQAIMLLGLRRLCWDGRC